MSSSARCRRPRCRRASARPAAERRARDDPVLDPAAGCEPGRAGDGHGVGRHDRLAQREKTAVGDTAANGERPPAETALTLLPVTTVSLISTGCKPTPPRCPRRRRRGSRPRTRHNFVADNAASAHLDLALELDPLSKRSHARTRGGRAPVHGSFAIVLSRRTSETPSSVLIPPTPTRTLPPTFVIRTLLPRTAVGTIVAEAMFVTSIPPVNDAVETSSELCVDRDAVVAHDRVAGRQTSVGRDLRRLAVIDAFWLHRSGFRLTSVRSTVSSPCTWL